MTQVSFGHMQLSQFLFRYPPLSLLILKFAAENQGHCARHSAQQVQVQLGKDTILRGHCRGGHWAPRKKKDTDTQGYPQAL